MGQSKLVHYPHMSLTRTALPISETEVKHPTFVARVNQLVTKMAGLRCLSLCGPKMQWDARIIIVRQNIYGDDYDCYINPHAPGYNDRHSIAPMYGMWENDVSTGSVQAWVVRPQAIAVTFMDEFGVQQEKVLTGFKARLFMHEYDFLQGSCFMHQAYSGDFIVSMGAMYEKDLWPVGYPSMEAHQTGFQQFFDYTTNQIIVPPGLEWASKTNQAAAAFQDVRLNRSSRS